MLELRSVALKADSRPISYRFEAGQISVVLGRNHSGKTLLTRIIAGLEPLAAGELLLDGERLDAVAPGSRPVSLVYQAFVNYPNWTVYQNLASPLKALAGRGRRSRAAETAEVDARVRTIAGQLALTPYLDRLPHTLSGGQQQRLAIGRALAKPAKVLVMDEPLVNLDYKLRERMQLELRSLLRETSMSVIYTTSDPRDAFALADQLVLLGDHSLLQAGEPLTVYQQPVSVAAADLLCDPRANRWWDGGALALVRPEHLTLAPTRPDDVVFEARVLDNETNGSETFLHCRVGSADGEHWVARLEGLVGRAPGSDCRLYAPRAAVLRFEGGAGG